LVELICPIVTFIWFKF